MHAQFCLDARLLEYAVQRLPRLGDMSRLRGLTRPDPLPRRSSLASLQDFDSPRGQRNSKLTPILAPRRRHRPNAVVEMQVLPPHGLQCPASCACHQCNGDEIRPEFAPALVEHLHTVASSSLLRRRVRRFGSGRDTSAAGLSCFRPAALRIAPRNTTSFPAVLTLPFFIAADFAASMSLASISKAAFVGSSWPQSSR
jgi:hypothetical protein